MHAVHAGWLLSCLMVKLCYTVRLLLNGMLS